MLTRVWFKIQYSQIYCRIIIGTVNKGTISKNIRGENLTKIFKLMKIILGKINKYQGSSIRGTRHFNSKFNEKAFVYRTDQIETNLSEMIVKNNVQIEESEIESALQKLKNKRSPG